MVYYVNGDQRNSKGRVSWKELHFSFMYSRWYVGPCSRL